MLIGMIIVACASIATAQSDDYRKFEFFFGYSHNRVDTGLSNDDPSVGDTFDARQGFHGFNTSITGNVSRYFGLKFDFSGHFKKRTFGFATFPHDAEFNSRLYNFLGGVQVKDNGSESRFKPFAHALVGAAHTHTRGGIKNIYTLNESDTGFSGVSGGGIDVRASDRVDIRALQLDYNPNRLFDNTKHNLRIGVGIVFH